MNAYNREIVNHIYPFLAEEWDMAGSALSEYLDYSEIILELVRSVRRRTTPGVSRFTQMVCLYQFEPLARSIAWFQESPNWPIEYQLQKVDDDYWRETCGKEVTP